MMNIALSELGKFLPNSFLVVIKLEELDLNVSLLHPLNEDEDFIPPTDTPSEGADPAYFQFSRAGILQVVDGVCERHRTEGNVDPVLHSEGLEPEDDSVELVCHLPPHVGRVGLELDLLRVGQIGLVVVVILSFLLQVDFLNPVEQSLVNVSPAGVDDPKSLPDMLESVLAGNVDFNEVLLLLAELFGHDLVNVMFPGLLVRVQRHPQSHSLHVSRDVLDSNCGELLGFLLLVVLTVDTSVGPLHLRLIAEPSKIQTSVASCDWRSNQLPKLLLGFLDDLNVAEAAQIAEQRRDWRPVGPQVRGAAVGRVLTTHRHHVDWGPTKLPNR